MIVWMCANAFLVAMVMSQAGALSRPWLNDDGVKVTNRTDTSVVLSWQLPTEMTKADVRKYRLFVSYKRRGYSLRIIEAQPSDPDCSLLLSYCHLRNLVPGQAYSAEISIDYVKNNTLLGRAVLPFATLDAGSSDLDVVWWLTFVAIPVVFLLLLLAICLCCARCWGCLCWRKKPSGDGKLKALGKPVDQTQSPTETKASRTSQGSHDKGRDLSHSLQTHQWVRDTIASMEVDPESTYDHPQASPPAYESPQPLKFPPHSPRKAFSSTSHSYMEMDENPSSPAGSDVSSHILIKSASTSTPQGKSKRNKFKRSETNPNLRPQASSEYSSPSTPDPRPAPIPCKIKQASLPNFHKLHQQPILPPESTQMSGLQQQLHAHLQQQQQLDQGPHDRQEVHYANTEDLFKLKGNARKMFPML